MRFLLPLLLLLVPACQFLGTAPASPVYLTDTAADFAELRALAAVAGDMADGGVTPAEAEEFGLIGARVIEIFDALKGRTDAEAERLDADEFAVLAQAVGYYVASLEDGP